MKRYVIFIGRFNIIIIFDCYKLTLDLFMNQFISSYQVFSLSSFYKVF